MHSNYYVVENRNLGRVVPSCRGVLPVVCDLEPSTMGRPGPELGCCDTEKEIETLNPAGPVTSVSHHARVKTVG